MRRSQTHHGEIAPTLGALAVLLALSACSPAEIPAPPPAGPPPPAVDESKPMLAADGPLRVVVLAAASEDEPPSFTRRLAFESGEKEIDALISVGEVPEGTSLLVSWYRRTPGWDHLFTQSIPIRSGQRARSQAVASGGISPGIYETVATLGEHQVRTPWVVRVGTDPAEEAGEVIGGAASAEYVPVDRDDEARPAAATPPSECTIAEAASLIEIYGELTARTKWAGPCGTVSLAVGFRGAPILLATSEPSENRSAVLYASRWLCTMPGGSDLPGTVVRTIASDSGGASKASETMIGDAGKLLTVAFDSRPVRGSRIEAGQRIEIDALAMLVPPSLGVGALSLEVNGEPIRTAGNLSGSAAPVACDPRRFFAKISNHPYRVPSNPPLAIEICARGVGFDGTEATDCGSFYTGEVWEGTIDGTMDTGVAGRQPTCRPERVPVRGTVRFSVGRDGAVSGHWSSANDPYECGVPGDPSYRRAPSVPTEFDFSGKRTADGFDLEVFGGAYGQLALKRTRREAQGEMQLPGGPGSSGRYRVSARCMSCE